MRNFMFVCLGLAVLLASCGSPPRKVEMKPGLENEFGSGDELTPEYEPADYTKDWRSIANLGGETSYPARVTLLIWKRRNWQTKLSGEWIDELVEDFQRRYRWNKELSEWVAEHGNPEWPR